MPFFFLIIAAFILRGFNREESPHFLQQNLSSKGKVVSLYLGQVGSYSGTCGFYGLHNPQMSSCEHRVEWYLLICLFENQPILKQELESLSFISLLCNHCFINFSEQSMLALCQGTFFRSSQAGEIFFLAGGNNLSKRKAKTKHSWGIISFHHLYRLKHPRYILSNCLKLNNLKCLF